METLTIIRGPLELPVPNMRKYSSTNLTSEEEQVTVDTPAWDRLVERRAVLIDKIHSQDQKLTDDEQTEYERLQRITRAAIARTFPQPNLDPNDLAYVKKVLGIHDDAEDQ